MIGNPAYTGTLISSQASGSAYTASVTATSLLPAAAKYTVPANGFAYIGQKLRMRAWGVVSTTSTPTLVLSAYMGGALLYASQAITTIALTTNTWFLEMDFTLQAVGSSALFAVSGFAMGFTGTAGTGFTLIPVTSPTTTSTFNSAAANAVDLYATWGTNNASTITCTQFELISPN